MEQLAQLAAEAEQQQSSPEDVSPASRRSKHTKAPTVTGRWTAEEHRLFLLGLEKFGHSWRQVSEHLLPHRTAAQIRSHAQKYLLSVAACGRGSSPGSLEDDGNAYSDRSSEAKRMRVVDAPTPRVSLESLARAAYESGSEHLSSADEPPAHSTPTAQHTAYHLVPVPVPVGWPHRVDTSNCDVTHPAVPPARTVTLQAPPTVSAGPGDEHTASLAGTKRGRGGDAVPTKLIALPPSFGHAYAAAPFHGMWSMASPTGQGAQMILTAGGARVAGLPAGMWAHSAGGAPQAPTSTGSQPMASCTSCGHALACASCGILYVLPA